MLESYSGKLVKQLVLLSVFLFSMYSNASTQESPRSIVVKLTSYANMGEGDVIVTLGSNGTQCSAGYWLSKSAPGYTSTYGLLVNAFNNGAAVKVVGNTLNLWKGGEPLQTICQISRVAITR